MRHEERVEIRKEGYKTLFDRLHVHSISGLPKHIDRLRLEKLYDRIDNEYEFVLRRKDRMIRRIR